VEELRNIAIDKLKNIKKDVGEVQSILDKLDEEVDSLKRKLPEKVDFDKFKIFLRRPYTIVPTKNDSWYIVVPKFIPFSVGFYDHSEGEYNYYMLNRYTQWLGEIPDWMKEEIKIPESMKITLVDGSINFEEGKEEEIRKKFGGYLTSVSRGTGKVRVGNEFELIAEIIRRGSLPFAPHPVDAKDIIKGSGKIRFEGEYEFQKEAIEKFMQYGCVSIHYPTGAGKDVIATHLLDIIKVDNLPNLYIAPNLTILEQMEKEYFPTFAPRLLKEMKEGQLILSTYQNYENLKDKEYGLVVFSENHVLPADTFSKLATLKTKYRIGASASPYREDGRTELIWALSGIPIGMNWGEVIKKLGKDYHDIYVHILPNERDKFKKTQDLFDPKKKTLIFTWRLDIGKKIAEMLGIPFISGETKNRIEIIKNNKAFVISSVGELGISIKDLEHIIEVDFLFGSKREEIQRTGRLLHSEEEKAKRHDILFSEDEYYKYGKRLRSLEEKGFFPVIMPYTSKLEFKEPKKSLKKKGKRIW